MVTMPIRIVRLSRGSYRTRTVSVHGQAIGLELGTICIGITA
eukprot:COSAG05_NODE_17732_length_320_cov_0.701357_1_plen_41_part_10